MFLPQLPSDGQCLSSSCLFPILPLHPGVAPTTNILARNPLRTQVNQLPTSITTQSQAVLTGLVFRLVGGKVDTFRFKATRLSDKVVLPA